jgi:hypothetical protein
VISATPFCLEVQMQEEAKIGGHYLNKKNGKIYIVLHNALASWDSYQNIVVYQKESMDAINQVWVRSLNEFKEKFEFLD